MGSLEAQGWMALKLYVDAKSTEDGTVTTVPVGDWQVATGEPVAVSAERVHVLGWEVDDATLAARAVMVKAGALADAVVGPNGQAFLYTSPGDPAQGGEYLRDESEVKASVFASLKQAWDDAGSNIDADASAGDGDEAPTPHRTKFHKKGGKK